MRDAAATTTKTKMCDDGVCYLCCVMVNNV